ERIDQRDRAERLLAHDVGLKRDFGQDRRRIEETLVADPLSAGAELRALLHRAADQPLHCLGPARVRHRAHRGAIFQTIAYDLPLRPFDEAIAEPFEYVLLHDEPRGRDAHLAAVAV